MATQTNTNQKKIFTEVNSLCSAYETTGVNILDRLPFFQFKTLKMCEFYSNSKYLRNHAVDGGNFNGSIDAGNIDELGREKPFYNIVNYRVTLAKVATDLDVKDIRIEGDHPKYWVKAMFLQREAYKWMTDKEVNFAYFLNKAGLTRPKYGGVLVKKTEIPDTQYKGKDKLCIDVVDWRNVVTDQIDILGGTIIENHFMTPVELSKKSGAWDAEEVREAIKKASQIRNRKPRGYVTQEYNSARIKVREVHGEFPIAFLKDAKEEKWEEEDMWGYSRQCYYISEVGNECFVFDAEEEKEQIYDYLPWEEMPGRALGRGVIEDSEEAQVWTNDSVINEKNAMDLAGRVVLTSNDPKIGNNILTVDNGKIFELKDGKELKVLTLAPAALGEFQNQLIKWQQQANYATSSFDANTGEQPPANTPYSQTALLNQIADKPFDFRREEMGIFISRIFDKWVIPYLVKCLCDGHTLTSEFSDEELELIDNSFALKKVNKEVIKKVIETGSVPSPEEYQGELEATKGRMYGKKRAIDFPDGYFDDIECSTTVVVTNEQKNKAAVLQSLAQVLKDVQASYNPQTGEFMILKNPVMAKIFGSIVEMSGIDLGPTGLGIDAYAKSEAPPVQPIPSPQELALPEKAPVVS